MFHRVSTVESAGEQNVEIKIFRDLTPRLATSKTQTNPVLSLRHRAACACLGVFVTLSPTSSTFFLLVIRARKIVWISWQHEIVL